jgi:hypothetical protein
VRSPGARRFALAFAATAAAVVAGCTLILPFDEVTPDDAGLDVVTPPRADVDGVDATTSDGASDAARDVDLDALGSCVGKTGTYCGNNQLDAYPFPDDLVVCDAGKVVAARPCTTGTKCIHLMNPHPDECDPCSGKVDGYYCGRELGGWDKTGTNNNANVRVHCRAGGVDGIEYCTTCTNGTTAGKATCP